MWLKRQFGISKAPVEQLGTLESELMERIWSRGETSVRDLHEELAPRLAYTTIMTTLDRLFKKGLLTRRRQVNAFYYSPRFTQQEYKEHVTEHLLGIALEEDSGRDVVLSCFVDCVTDKSAELLDELERLVKAKRLELRRKG
jgi:predicted transcriptional regulator